MRYVSNVVTVIEDINKLPRSKLVKCGAYTLPRQVTIHVAEMDEDERSWLVKVVIESNQKTTRVTEMTTRAPKGCTLADFDSEVPMHAIKSFFARWLTQQAVEEERIEPTHSLRTAYQRRAYLWISARIGNESPQMEALRRWEEEYEPLGLSQGEAAEEMGLGYATLRTYLGEARKERDRTNQHERGK